MKSKVFLGSLYLIFVLLFTSCNVVSIGNNGGQLIFTLGEDVVNVISSRQATGDDTGDDTEELEYSVKVSLTGDYSATVEKKAPLSTLATIPFEFEGIPIGARVRASCSVSTSSGVPLWGGSSNSVKIAGATNRASITLGVHTGIVVWTESGGSITLKVASTPDDVENANQIGLFTESLIFTFGNNVELYYLNHQDNIMVSHRNAQGEYEEGSTLYEERSITGSLTQDKVTGKLYGLNDTIVVRLEDRASYESNSDAGGMDSPAGFVVEDDVFYLYSEVSGGEETTSSNTCQIEVGKYTINFASSSDDSRASELDKKTITLPSTESYPTISDAIIQDGALYLLLRDVDTFGGSAFYSRGGLIKINLSTLELDTSFGKGGILGWTRDSVSFNDTTTSETVVHFYGPSDENSTNFIGPVKFVGIMPKKLVIAEHGFHISGVLEGSPEGKRKSRLVVVDLETASAREGWDYEYKLVPVSSETVYYETSDVSFSL